MVQWNDPDNFKFTICTLAALAYRMQFVHLQLTYGLNVNYQNSGADRFALGNNWSPKFCFSSYQMRFTSSPVGDEPESELIGPLLQFIPGGGLFHLTGTASYNPVEKSFLQTLIDWKRVPSDTTWQSLADAISTQTITQTATDYPASDAGFGDYYRTEFIESALLNRPIWWSQEDMTEPDDGWRLGFGRFPPLNNPGVNDLVYKPFAVLSEPIPGGFNLYKLRCGSGCCCCCC